MSLSSIFDILSFDAFDTDDSLDMPNVSTKPYILFEQEEGMLNLLREDFNNISADSYAELEARQKEYYDLMMSDEILSAEESAMFDEQYENELSALEEKYAIQFERHGASRMADLASRGVLETTTGMNTISEDQQQYSDLLGQGTSAILQDKELAKMDFAEAKRTMAQKGYNLTSGIYQNKISTDMSKANLLQNYETSQGIQKVGRELTNAMREQSWNQYAYNQKKSSEAGSLGLWSTILEEFL